MQQPKIILSTRNTPRQLHSNTLATALATAQYALAMSLKPLRIRLQNMGKLSFPIEHRGSRFCTNTTHNFIRKCTNLAFSVLTIFVMSEKHIELKIEEMQTE